MSSLHSKFLSRDTDLESQSNQEMAHKHRMRTKVGLLECLMVPGTPNMIYPAHVREVLISKSEHLWSLGENLLLP